MFVTSKGSGFTRAQHEVLFSQFWIRYTHRLC